MIIDFHTHVFPDELADKAIKALTESCDNLYLPVSDGTVTGLLRKMDEWGIDASVIQPVITKKKQFEKTNQWAADVQSDRIVSFGGIYPHTDDYKRDIDFVRELGLRGLKFHAEYQDFILDDPHMLKIYDYALSCGMIIIHHAGFDPAFPPPFRSNPERFARVVDAMGGGIIVAAHLGGHAQWDDVEKYLVGKDIYLDTSMGFEYFSKEQFLRIVKDHGANRILFSSDAPWSAAGSEIQHIRSLPLSDDIKAKILSENARRLLRI